ncbi:RHS repeat-associated core domain-containing protein [Candidatus Albibeggiatoa sp. nov. NOAA]|uniref:RHS repeat-associated core domain-containing protein n=1 Tax=Candidatus Albibeggiatoa sp. nov. NOAA TaxID=3162724 RepID=UPI0032F33588|nr:DUF6531 domain-containing protein [Thiotrichaceae bacterium]
MFKKFIILILLLAVSAAKSEDMSQYLQPTFACQWDTNQSPDDETPTDPLVALVKKLNKEPVAIFNWVRNNINDEFYVGSRKGALCTFRTKRGNAWDQSSLLITLMRIAGVPAQYSHHGLVGKYSVINFKEFIFVKVYVDYSKYRGHNSASSKINKYSWITLCPWGDKTVISGINKVAAIMSMGSLGVNNLNYNLRHYIFSELEDGKYYKVRSPLDIFEENLAKSFRGESYSPNTDLEYLDYSLMLRRKTIEQRKFHFLPASLPSWLSSFSSNEIDIKGDCAEVPLENRISAKLYVFGADKYGEANFAARGTPSLGVTLYLAEVAGKKVTLEWQDHVSYACPRLLVDGELHKEGLPIYYTRGKSFFLSYQPTSDNNFVLSSSSLLEPFDRPLQPIESVTAISFDYLSASEKNVEDAKLYLSINSATDVVSADFGKKRAYLENLAHVFASTFNLRAYEIIRRVNSIFHCEPLFKLPSPTFIHIPLKADTQKIDDEAKFLYHYPAQIDAFGFFSEPIKTDNKGNRIATEYFNKKIMFDLIGDSISFEESRIFEDIQDTPSSSTVKSFLVAADMNLPIFFMEKDKNGTAWLTSYRPVDKWTSVDTVFFAEGFTVDRYNDGYRWIRLASKDDFIYWVRSYSNATAYPLPPFAYAFIWNDFDRFGNSIFTGSVVPVAETGAFTYLCYNDDQTVKGYVFYGADQESGGTNGGMSGDEVVQDNSYQNWDDYYNQISGNSTPETVSEVESTYKSSDGLVNMADDNANSQLYADGDPVDMLNGEFYHECEPDIFVPGTGFDLSVKRKYKSKLIYNGPFGYGWTWNHAERIVPRGDTVTYYSNDCKAYEISKKTDGPGQYAYPAGTTFVMAKDDNGYYITLRNKSVIHFDNDGYLQKKIDTYGNKLSFVYKQISSGRKVLDYFSDGTGRKIKFSYFDYAKVSNIKYVLPNSADTGINFSYTYDNYGIADYEYDLIASTNAVGKISKFKYLKEKKSENPALNHNMSRCSLPNGDYLDIYYYKNDTVSHHTNKLRQTFNFNYSRLNQFAETWNEAGYYRKIYFNSQGDVIRINNRNDCIESKKYDPSHNLTVHNDGRGIQTYFYYDEQRNMLKKLRDGKIWLTCYNKEFNLPTATINPENEVTIVSYNEYGKLEGQYSFPNATANVQMVDTYKNILGSITFTDGAGNCVFSFDSSNRITSMAVSGDIKQVYKKYTYSSEGLLAAVTNQDGNSERFKYDGMGYLISRQDQNGNRSTLVNDLRGLPVITTDSAGFSTYSYYYKDGKPSKNISPDKAVTTFIYNDNGQLLKTILPDSSEIVKEYGIARDIVTKGKVIRETDPLGGAVKYDYDVLGRVTSVTDKNGAATTFQYDTMDQLVCKKDVLGETVNFTYDANGNMLTKTDKRGNVVSFTYDNFNKKISETYVTKQDVSGNVTGAKRITYEYYPDEMLKFKRVLTSHSLTNFGTVFTTYYVYDSLNRLIEQHDNYGKPDVRITRTEYVSERHIKVTNADGVVSEKKLDPVGNLIEETVFAKGSSDTVKSKTEYVYDSRNLLVEKKLYNGGRFYYEYDAMKRLVCETDPAGNSTRYSYDLRGNQVTVKNAENDIATKSYDKMGRMVKAVDYNGNATTFEYDANGNVLSQTDAEGNVSYSFYDALNRQIATQNALGARTVFDYDENGNLSSRTNALGQTTTYTYNPLNQLLTTTNHLGHVTSNEYDLQGRLWKTTDARGTITENCYNDFSELTQVITDQSDIAGTPASVNSVTNVYDKLGRVLMSTDAAGIKTVFEYDELGRVVKTVLNADGVDANGNAILKTGEEPSVVNSTVYDYHYDNSAVKAGAKVISTQAVGSIDEAVTVNKYDLRGNLSSITNAENHTVSYEYDALNRKVKAIDADLTEEQFDYDANSNLIKHTKRDNTVVNYEFDALNRNKTVKEGGTLRQEFFYDDISRLSKAIDHNQGNKTHTVEYRYDYLNRVISETQDGVEVHREYEWKAKGFGPSPFPTPEGSTFTAQFYPNRYSYSVMYENGANGLLNNVYSADYMRSTYINVKTVAANTYYKNNQLSSQTLSSGDVSLTHSLWYDAMNREAVRDYKNGSTVIYQQNTSLYDAFGNIKQEVIDPVAEAALNYQRDYSYDLLSRLKKVDNALDEEQESWNYDLVGNWTFTNQNGVDENRTPNADNEYINSEFSYNAVGNLTAYADKQFRYDWANRLIEVSDNSGIVASYTYDALNRRITKHVVADDITTSYIYFGSQVLEELENGTLKRRYIYGSYVDEPLSMYDAETNKTYTYLRDRQYSVVALVDDQGAVVESYRYSAFGLRTVYDANGVEIACSNYNNVYGYTGRRYDAESALWYYRNRMYSPEVGRFLQRDPAGYVDGMNLYAYVRNNPLLFLDPMGLTAQTGINWNEILQVGSYTEKNPYPRTLEEAVQYYGLEREIARELRVEERWEREYFRSRLTDIGLGSLQVIGGFAESAVGSLGIFTPEPGTTAAGIVAFGHGVDVASAGVNRIMGGEGRTYTSSYVSDVATNACGVDESTARIIGDVVDAGISMGTTMSIASKSLSSSANYVDDAISVRPAPKSGETVKLYRGVKPSHPGYKNATQGVTKPRRSVLGHSNAAKHNAGNTKSKLTSWSTDRNVAKRFSRDNGVILEIEVPVKNTILSPDKFNEAEVLLKGTIKGAKVTYP